MDFIKALAATNNVNIFLNFSVQAIINYHWKRVKVFSYCQTMLPYLIQLISFSWWSNVTLADGLLNTDKMDSQICIFLLRVISWYFVILEFNQILKMCNTNGHILGIFYYLMVFWNYVETIPLILIIYNVERSQSMGHLDIQFYRVQSFAALTLWLKFFYFLRQFESTSYLIRSLIEVFKDMYVFMGILLCLIIGYADAFSSLSKSYVLNDESEGKLFEHGIFNALGYSYALLLGNFETEAFDAYGWILFITASVIEIVVLLNLLIAIISDTFARVCTDQIQYTYKERVSLIADIYSLIGTFKDHETSNLLFFAREDPDNKEAVPDEMDNEVDTMEEQITKIYSDMIKVNHKLDKIGLDVENDDDDDANAIGDIQGNQGNQGSRYVV